MLVLTRRIKQTIVIGGNITVVVLGVERNKFIWLGFAAPDDVVITCGELVGSENTPHSPHKKTEGMLILTREAN